MKQMAYIEGQKAEKAARVKAEKDLESMYSAQTMAQETMLEQIAKSEASARTANSLSAAKTDSTLRQGWAGAMTGGQQALAHLARALLLRAARRGGSGGPAEPLRRGLAPGAPRPRAASASAPSNVCHFISISDTYHLSHCTDCIYLAM